MADVALSECVSSQIIDNITRLENQLDQLRHEQEVLSQSIANASGHNASDDEELTRMKETMVKVSAYYTKLVSLRSTMTMLSTRTGQLHRRADKLKQIKLQYLSQIDSIRRTEQERDQVIAARVVSPSTSKASLLSPQSPIKTSSKPPRSPSSSSPIADATIFPTPTPDAAVIVAGPSVSDTPVVAVAKKVKKKKPKAREVAISDEAWTPKRTTSSRSFASNKN